MERVYSITTTMGGVFSINIKAGMMGEGLITNAEKGRNHICINTH